MKSGGGKQDMIGHMEGTHNGILAFAPYVGQMDITTATTPHTDVFARRERQLTSFSPLEPKLATVYIQFKDRPGILITYPDAGAGLPPWVVPVLRSLSERRGMEPGWDSYDAKPTESRHIDLLMSYLFVLMRHNSTPPIITPLWDGGVQATWHRNNKDFEIVVSADEPPMYYLRDPATDAEEEEKLEPNLARVRALIGQF
jgi:hypothetical protein